jgi:hypothetical protein
MNNTKSIALSYSTLFLINKTSFALLKKYIFVKLLKYFVEDISGYLPMRELDAQKKYYRRERKKCSVKNHGMLQIRALFFFLMNSGNILETGTSG